MNHIELPKSISAYPRKHGRPGIRNHLLILSVCGLNSAGARKVHAALPQSILIDTAFGRGQVGTDKVFHDALLAQFACHPNVGAVILIAPDKPMRERYQATIESSGRSCAGFSLQEHHEDSVKLVTDAISAGERLGADLMRAQRQACPMSALAIAIECGHSDATSGIIANPLAGDLADHLISLGGAVVISETMEWTGTEDDLYARCQTQKVADKLKRLVTQRHQIAADAGIDIHYGNPGPQNHAGGITTLEEKSRGAIAKGGTTAIVGALAQAEEIPMAAGLYLMDTPALSPESISSMVAATAQLVIFTTGQGNPYGSAVSPTLKLTANPETATRLPQQIDFDASKAFTGEVPRESLLNALAGEVAVICEGRLVAAEILDEGSEAISRLSASI